MENLQAYLPALGRLLLSGLFIWGGYGKLRNLGGTVQYFASNHVPVPGLAVWVAIVVEFVGGIALLLGFETRWVAGVLAIWSVITGFAVHLATALSSTEALVAYDNKIHFYKNLAIAGGLLLVVTYGAGELSIDHSPRGVSATSQP
jgi:putative oxidoreductase